MALLPRLPQPEVLADSAAAIRYFLWTYKASTFTTALGQFMNFAAKFIQLALPKEQQKMSDQHVYKFEVKMNCGGCSGAVERALSKLDGVSSYETSLEKQEVIVRGSASYDTVLEKIKKTGKEVKSGETLA